MKSVCRSVLTNPLISDKKEGASTKYQHLANWVHSVGAFHPKDAKVLMVLAAFVNDSVLTYSVVLA
jgi:hypothetical protein